MESYRILYLIRITHDYFDGKPCPALQCRLTQQSEKLARRRGLLFRQMAAGEWAIFYNSADAGPNTANDILELDLHIIDTSFALYTDWVDFRPSAAHELMLSAGEEVADAATAIRPSSQKRGIGTGFCIIRLPLTNEVMEAAATGKAMQSVLHFRTLSVQWEYLFFSRKEDPAEGLLLEDMAGLVEFPAFEEVEAYGRTVWRTLSKNTVPMRQAYGSKLRLVQQNGDGRQQKRVLLSRIEPPEVGRFRSEVPGIIRQVCYF